MCFGSHFPKVKLAVCQPGQLCLESTPPLGDLVAMHTVGHCLGEQVCPQKRSRNYALTCFEDTSPAINYQPLALSNSWSSASPTTFVLRPQRRSSDLVVSPLNSRVSKRQQHTLEPKPRPSTPPLQNPAILILTTTILAAKILPAEIKAAPNVHPAVVPRLSTTGLNLPYHSQSARSTDATAARHQMQTRIVVVNPVHPAVGKTPGQESVMPVVPTRHHQNGKGTDVHTAPHLNQICQHCGTDVIGIGTAPYHLRRHPHIRLPQVARLHPATDTAIKGEGITADGDDDTVLVQPASHPSLVPPTSAEPDKAG